MKPQVVEKLSFYIHLRYCLYKIVSNKMLYTNKNIFIFLLRFTNMETVQVTLLRRILASSC